MKYLILAYPWIELFTLIQLGAKTSALTALGYVFVTIIFGIAIIRYQGLALIFELQNARKNGKFLSRALGKDLWMVVSGLLFIIPGLVSDFFALIFLIVSLRPYTGDAQLDRKHNNNSRKDQDSGLVIDGSYTKVDETSHTDH